MTVAFAEGERLSSHTTFRIGGEAKAFGVCRSIDDLRDALRAARDKKLPVVILAGGSNVLFGDNGFDGFVLKIEIGGETYHDEGGSVLAVAGAGIPWDEFVKGTVAQKLWGLENLSGIPGTVGAAPIQNIGAYGKEVSSLIEWVEVFDPAAENVKRLSPVACLFGYRESIFKQPLGSSLVVTRVAFRLSEKGVPQLGYKDFAATPSLQEAAEPSVMRDAVLAIRAKKFPPLSDLGMGTAGSFFKNPFVTASHANALAKRFPGLPIFDTATGMKKISAAWLIDHVAGMRSAKDGLVGTYEGQALVLVAEHGARADDVIRFAKKIRDRVRDETRVTLEPEVRMIGCALDA